MSGLQSKLARDAHPPAAGTAEIEPALRGGSLYASVFDQVEACFALLSPNGRFLQVNRAFARAWRQDIGAFPGRAARELFPGMPAAFDAWEELFHDALRTRRAVRRENRPLQFPGRPESEASYWDWITQPILDCDGEVSAVVYLSLDVTERKRSQDARERAEQARQDSERQFRSLAQVTPDFVVRWDTGLRRTYVNRAFAEAIGKDPQELIGGILGDTADPQRDPEQANSLAAVAAAVTEVIGRGKPCEMQVGFQSAVAGPRIMHNRFLPEFDAGGTLTGVISVGHDITELKQTEEKLRRLNAELEARIGERTAQLKAANAELQTFAYLVSHDLKAPLRGIDGYSRLLQEQYGHDLPPEAQLFARNIRDAAVHMGRLIDDLLAYSRMERQQLAPEPVDLAQMVDVLVREQRELLRLRGMPDGPRLDLAPEACRLLADPQGLMVILRNLLSNALKFTRTVASPAVEIGARVEGDKVLIWVRDNGIGFDMKFHDRIFEIFQRLQLAEDYPGTGVGLALVRRAAQRMGGRVWAESAAGRGACFYLELPR
jgi:PAS domain S-box-containing protein